MRRRRSIQSLSCGLLSTLYSLSFAEQANGLHLRETHRLSEGRRLRRQNLYNYARPSSGYFFLADQLNRAALSVAANIAEGNGRFTKADRRNFFGIARGSVQECVPLLELAVRQGLPKADRHQQLKADLEEISRMLSGLINGLEKREV
jgi:four helix bundle protein